MTDKSPKLIIGVFLILILAVAVFFRLYDITQTPPGLYPDEAVNGVNALDAISSGHYKVFYPENNGREGLFINIQALSVKYFGAHPWSLRIVSGVFGILTVLGLFLLVNLLWGPQIALMSSYLVAISFWPVNFSRIGFRAVMLPFILVWAFYFLWKGMRSKSKILLLIAGLVYGIGFNTYISWRVSPLLLGILFLAFLFNRDWKKSLPPSGHSLYERENKKYVIKSGLVFLIGALIAMAPLGLYYLKHPSDFMGRAAQVSIFNSPSPIRELADSAMKTLGMFNIYGDGNWRHNLAGRPELFWPIGIGFLIGLMLVSRHPMSLKNSFLLTWFLIMLLPNFLAPEGAPHALRALGAMPAVFILSAIGLDHAYKWLRGRFGRNEKIKKELAVLAALFLIFVGVWEYKTYFIVWASRSEVTGNFDQRLVDIGNYLKNLPDSTAKYAVVNESGTIVKGIPIQAQPIMFSNYGRDITYLNASDIANMPKTLFDAVIIPTKSDPNVLNLIRQKYPQSRETNSGTFRAIRIQKVESRK